MVKRILIRAVVVIACLFIVIAGLIVLLRGSGASRLEKWKREMRARGEKFTVAELAPGPVVSNVMIGRFEETLKQMPPAPLASKGLELMESNKVGGARVSWRATNDWPAMHQLLDENAGLLAALREALKARPRDFGWDYTNWSGYPKGGLIEVRKAAHWLGSAVVIEMNRARRSEALTNLLSLLELVHCHDQERTFVFQMIRIALANLAFAASWEALQAKQWADQELAELQQSWQRVSLGDSVEVSIQMERAISLIWFEMISHGTNISDAFATSTPTTLKDDVYEQAYMPVWRMAFSKGDELAYMRSVQVFLDAMRTAKTNSSISQLQALTLESELSGSLAFLRFPLSRMMMPNFVRALKKWGRAETQRQLVLAAIGLERFRLRTGHYPEKLDELVPEILPSIPVDFGDGKPLRYERQGDQFRLWSIMEDAVWPRAE